MLFSLKDVRIVSISVQKRQAIIIYKAIVVYITQTLLISRFHGTDEFLVSKSTNTRVICNT